MSKSTRNSGQPWTASDRKELNALAKQNTPTRVIGLKLGRTPDAVQSQASRQGTSLKPTNQSPYNRKSK
jgi:IS30 family transposase